MYRKLHKVVLVIIQREEAYIQKNYEYQSESFQHGITKR